MAWFVSWISLISLRRVGWWSVNERAFLWFTSKEDLRMDAHFSEYLAAVRAMQEIYGERAEDFPTEFHGEIEQLPEARPVLKRRMTTSFICRCLIT